MCTAHDGELLTQVGVVVTSGHVQFEACHCCHRLTTGLLKQSACCALQVMQYADRALMEGLKGRCAMLLHPHVTQDSALLLLQQALAMDSDRCTSAHHFAPFFKCKETLGSPGCRSGRAVCLRL
jgi:hypothetical protein